MEKKIKVYRKNDDCKIGTGARYSNSQSRGNEDMHNIIYADKIFKSLMKWRESKIARAKSTCSLRKKIL